MTEPTTEPGKWLVAEYARTPGDPKWYPGLGLESTVIAIEAEAFASLDARYAAQLNLTIKANSTIEDLREELHAAHEHRRVVEEYMAAPDPAPLDVERLARALGSVVPEPDDQHEYTVTDDLWYAAAIAREYAKEEQP
jgi:hypothetical protein